VLLRGIEARDTAVLWGFLKLLPPQRDDPTSALPPRSWVFSVDGDASASG
jgi:hypothetical protein